MKISRSIAMLTTPINWFGLLLSCILFIIVGFEAKTYAADPIETELELIKLPAFEVKTTPEIPAMESGWRRASIPGFEILSGIGDTETKKIVRDLQIRAQLIDLVWPDLGKVPVPTVTLVLCASDGQYERLVPHTVMKDLPAPFVSPEINDSFVVYDENSGDLANIVPEATALRRAGVLLIRSPRGNRRYEDQIARAYVLIRLAQLRPRLRSYLEEGIAQACACMDVRSERVIVGSDDYFKPEGWTGTNMQGLQTGSVSKFNITRTADPSFLTTGQLMPMTDLVGVAEEESLTFQPRTIWSIQSSVFVYLCLYGNGRYSSYRKGLDRLSVALAAGPKPKEQLRTAIENSFGKSLNDIEVDLRAFCRGEGSSASVLLKPKKSQRVTSVYCEPEAFELRDAQDAEIAMTKAFVNRASSEIDRANQDAAAEQTHLFAAQTEYHNAYRRGCRDPQMLGSWGLYILELKAPNSQALALRVLGNAFTAGNRESQVCAELGRLRFEAAMQKPEGKSGRLSAKQLAAILAPLIVQRGNIEACRTAVLARVNAETSSDKEELAWFNESARKSPKDIALLSMVAVLDQFNGYKTEALALINQALAVVDKPADKEKLLRLQAQIAAARP